MNNINELLNQYQFNLKGKIEKIIKENISNNDCLINRIALVYDRGQYEIIPPIIGILYNKDFPEDDFESLWNPEEFDLYATKELAIDSSPENLVNTINMLCRENRRNEESVITMFLAICIEMTKWIRNTQKDKNSFFFATDPEMVEIKKNLSIIKNKVTGIDNRMPDWF